MKAKDSHFDQRRHSALRKAMASFVILAFFFSQTIPSGFADITLRPETRVVPYQPETDATDDSSNPQQTDQTPEIPIDPTAAFSQNELSLTPSNSVSNDQQASVQSPRDATEYSFDQAADYLTPDYAAAVVVEDVTANDLRSLVREDVEVAIVVIRGQIVMFTTGSRDELRANPVARELLAESPILIHTHLQGDQTRPSALDISLAGTATEYLLSSDGVYAYNMNGLISNEPLAEEDLVQLIKAVHAPEASSVEARAVLNWFIANIDEYNTNPEQYSILRSSQPISVLPGRPALGTWSYDGHSDPTVFQQSTSEFSAAYNVTAPGSYSGVTINFAATSGGSQNLESLGNFSFDFMNSVACTASGEGRCLKLEFKDTTGRVGAYAIKNLYTTYTNIVLPITRIKADFPKLDLMHIKEINFVFENSANGVSNPVKAATLSVKLGGLFYTPVISTTTSAALSNLAGATVSEMEPCNVALVNGSCPAGHLVNTVSSFTQNGTTGFSLGYSLANGTGNNRWAASMMTFPDAGLFDAQSGNLVLSVNDGGAGYYKIDVIDAQGQKVTLKVTVDGKIEITDAILQSAGSPNFDSDQIKYVVLVVDDPSATTGTLTLTTSGLVYVPVVDGTPYNPGFFTDLPGFPSLSSNIGAANGGTANGTITTPPAQTDPNHFSFDYTLADQDDFVYAQMGWGYFRDPDAPQISGIDYVRDVGFRLTIQDPEGVEAYDILYTDDGGQTWKTAKSNLQVTGSGTTTWLDDGSTTDPDPLQVNVRWYEAVVSKSHQVFEGTPQDLSGGLTFAAKGPAGTQLKVEVVDQNGKVASFYINLVGGLPGDIRNYSLPLTPANVPSGFDNTHIALVNFVADKNHMGAVGKVSIETQNLSYLPVVNGLLTGIVTDVHGAGVGQLGDLTVVGSVSQASPSGFNFVYTSQPNKFGGAIVIPPAGSELDLGTSPAVFQVTGVTKIVVSVSDDLVVGTNSDGSNRYRSVNILYDLTTGSFVSIDKTTLLSIASDFDVSHITSVSFVADKNILPALSGTVTVVTQNLGYISVLTGDGYNPGALSGLDQGDVAEGSTAAGAQGLIISTIGAGHENGTASMVQTDGEHFTWTFDLPNEPETALDADGESDDLAIGEVAWGYFNGAGSYVGSDSGQLPASFVIGANGTNGLKVKVEIYDTTGAKVVYLLAMTGSWQNYTLDLSSIDHAHIGRIVFVSEKDGSVQFHMPNLKYIPVVSEAAGPLTAADISHLPDLRQWAGYDSDGAGNAVSAVFNQSSATQGSLLFNISQANSFAGLISTFDDFGTAGTVEDEDLSGISDFVIGLSLSAGSGMVEFLVEDASGNKRSVYLSGVDGTERFYRISKTLLSGIDWMHVTAVVVTAIQGKVTNPNATLNARFGDHPYSIPVPSVIHDPALQSQDITLFPVPMLQQVVAFDSEPPENSDGMANVMLISPSLFDLHFDVSNTDSFGGSISTFDNFGTANTRESVNLSGMNEFIFGLRLRSGAGNIELLFEDDQKKQSKVLLLGVDQTEKFFRVPTSLFSGIDWTHICNIVIAVSQKQVTATKDTLEVRLGNHPYNPVTVISGNPYNSTALTALNGQPSITSGSGNTISGKPIAQMQLTQNSGDEFQYEYNLGGSNTSFTFASITNGEFQSGLFVGQTISLSQQFVIAAQGAAGQRLRIDIRDVDQLKASFILDLNPFMQNYVLDLSASNIPIGFDYTHIADIVFVQDWSIGSRLLNDVVTIQTNGLAYTADLLPTPLQEIQSTLTTEGLDYFKVGAGVDPVTHFPYDHRASNGSFAGFTQPTLIGFYTQILGDIVRGTLDNGMSVTEALGELDAVLTNLRDIQSDNTVSWNGLIPWMDLSSNPPTPVIDANTGHVFIGFLDNANMAQSLAVMVGALQSAGLAPGPDLDKANEIIAKAEAFLDAQTLGYQSFVDPAEGIFRMSYDRNTGEYSSWIDRLASEVRGAVAFIQVRYPGIPQTVWDNLEIKTANYTDRNGTVIANAMAWDGAAFQIFWPSLRNDERAFIGFRNMLYNQLVSQMDWAAQNNLPGILSASSLPEGGYYGAIGVPGLAEQTLNPTNLSNYYDTVLMNTGSTYALAAAVSIDPYAVLGWLDVFYDNVAGLANTYGFYDAARSSSEIAHDSIGIDVASAVLGLGGNGPKDFEAYLMNKGLGAAYNLLYDSASKKLQAMITRTTAAFPNAPTIPDRSFSVFSNFASEGTDGSFPSIYSNSGATGIYGAQFKGGALAGGWGGHFWKFNQPYDAQANQLVLLYTTADTPGKIKIELKDASGNLLYKTPATLALADGVRFGRLVIDLPNQTLLSAVKQVDFLVVDQGGSGDTSFDFTIHSLMFQHFSSEQSLMPASDVGAGDVTTLPGDGQGQLASSSPNSHVTQLSPKVFQLHFDLTAANAFAELFINYDPSNNGSSVDLSGLSQIVFGLDSDKATMVKIEIEDADGKRATYYAQNVDVDRSYYKFLTSLAAGNVDLTHITSLHVSVDANSVSTGNETGDLEIEIGGLS